MYHFGRSSNQATFRAQSPLSNDMIARFAPSVMAHEAHESRGDRYSFIPTIQVIDGLRAEGFEPYEVRQTRVRDAGKREHTKHLVRLRHASHIQTEAEVPEIVLVNSHDGTSSYQIMSGVFRFVCSNGLIAGNVHDDIRVRHSGNVVDDVIDASWRVVEAAEAVTDRIAEYKGITLTQQEQHVFASSALQLRWDADKAPVVANSVLRPQRHADYKDDLWTTFNRVQENLVRGGVRGRSATGRRMSTREVGGVNENVKLNKALWSLADGLAQLKQGKATDEFVAAYEHAYL
jgi:hypothetical protein